MPPTPIKYAIADDHKIFRQGLRTVLEGDDRFVCAGDVGNGKEMLQLLSRHKVDVVLLDLKMPVMDGIATAIAIKADYPSTRVIMLTMFEEDHFVVHMMENGANGYLIKSTDAEEIKMALESVHKTGHYFSDVVGKALLTRVAKKSYVLANFNQVQLTDKEIEILKLICEEMTTPEISKKMFLSHRTIEGMRSALLDKIGVKNSAGLVVYAIRTGIYS